MTAFDPPPVKTVRPEMLWKWQQLDGGGCRCACAFYHRGRGLPGSVCMAAAELGMLVRVEAEGEVVGPLPVCGDCYAAMPE